MTKLATAALLAAMLGACSGGGGNAPATANAAAGAAALGPLTAQELCDRLTPAAVADIIGFDPSAIRASASTSSTPQCSFSYPHGPGDFTITVAYLRPDDELAGNRGEAGYDYVLRMNRSMAPGVQEQPVRAGQRAARLSGTNLQLGIVLTSGRVLTVIADTSLPAAMVDRLIQAAGEAFGR